MCIVESTARLHPSRRIFVLFLTDKVEDILQVKTLSALLSFPNVYLRFIKPKQYVTIDKIIDMFIVPFFVRYLSSPAALKWWFIKSDFHKSPHVSVFLENALGYVLLKKFGGAVLSFDTLLVKSITSLGQFYSRCEEHSVQPMPMALDDRHPVFDNLFSNMMRYFDDDDPTSIGSKLITEVLKHECKVIIFIH